jgi:DNA-binding NarL/FixJ family response regulator
VRLISPSPALRAGLRSLLTIDENITVVDEQSEWSDSLQEVQIKADVVITTSALNTSNPIEEGEDLPTSAILYLQDEASTFIKPINPTLRIWGVLPLDASPSELSAAVHALAEGLIVGTQTLMFPTSEYGEDRGPLTERESEVLGLLALGLANKQIALKLGISEHTVKFHVSSIYTKLNASNRTQAVREGLRKGWIIL